jgi:hypothetical protein
MTSDRHKAIQTAFRLPDGRLAWLRQQAQREHRTMTDIVAEALDDYEATHATPAPVVARGE